MKRRHFAGAALLLPLAGALRAQTPAWPQRPVKFILSQPAGAGPDILARYVTDQLARLWNQGIVVENRPGGQNVIGAQAAARSPADGYTFYYATTAAMVTNAFTFKTLPYDPVKDFVPVRLVGRSPFVIAAASGFAGKDLAETLAMAKAQPGVISIATEGPKTFSGMLADSVAAKAGVKLNHVPYTKAPEAIQDVVGGRVQLVCLPDAALTAFIKSGQLRALAVSTAQRQADMPNVPALSETFPGFEYTGWNGVFAPTGTPADVVARVNRDLETVLRQPEVAQRMQQLGSLAEQKMSVAEFDAFMRGEHSRWRDIVKALGITAE
ncbi:MAG: Bug family tripartite tricarboxylate transporter substrate binding protein [Hydrogenophaga sp.]|jgi:tripartite-type tricarboxylate transporter receptor subunit TctC|uniref:Bug family tripartite tricarboxylate transporter substrate binding protein n=1 Tax=Hydrogenophaga sp. TaxID=1904254 RepID=UPI001DE5EE4A|nr:tripartite tricarboxylate transporter substrate-binding protein [Hydrogenophaga sp.]MBW0169589.1 tripartite tricarboxylate transporter substrate binding protein [Hydrogenophaga sp.]MBW0183404.1 tripartite tricarboxylate transporter substrate binding protein [Hydrogenophaga sp.]